MSEDYTRRDYAEDMPDSKQATSVSAAANQRQTGPEYRMSELDWGEEPEPGHESDEAAVAGYCGGSRDTREPTDKADELAAKFEDF